MPATFTLTLDDITLAQKAIRKRFMDLPGVGTNILTLQIAAWMFLGLALVAFLGLYNSQPTARLELFYVGSFALCALVLNQLAKRHWRHSLMGEITTGKGAHLAPKTVEFSDASLTVSGPHAKTIYSWQAFVAHTEDAGHHYLFTDVDTAVALPRSAIEDTEEFAHYLQRTGLRLP